MKRILVNFLIAFFLGILSLSAQIDYDIFPEVSSTYFINDVHIQKSPTDSFGLGDILLVDGYIKQVGRELTPPVEAYIVEADSAYAYPAFIAGLAHTGIAKSEKGEKPAVKFRGHPPNGVVGITPEILAHEKVSAMDDSVKKMKASGFGLSHVVPQGTMLPGQGSLMLLEGKSNEEMLYAEKTSMFFQLKGTRGFYPTTVIGVMAKWRDLYRKAGFLSKHQAVQKSSTAPLKRAKSDKALAALIPATQGKQPIFMKAEKAKAIHKAIALKKELGYDLVLAEVKQAAPVLDKIKKNNIPVLISAKLPKEVKEEKETKEDDNKDKEEKEKDKKEKVIDAARMVTQKPSKEKKEKKASEDKDSPEVKAMKERKKKSYEEYVGQAAMLEKEGIAFGFSFLDSKPDDLKKSLKRMMDAGLSQAGALAALTTNPAKMLGVEGQVGTITNGKLANIFISTEPYFSDDAAIKYVFIEGKMTEQEIKPKKKKGNVGDADMDFGKRILGSWSYEVITPEGPYTGMIIISGEEDAYAISVTSDGDDEVMTGREISLGEETLSYVMTVVVAGQDMPATNELSFDGNDFSGTVTIAGLGSMPISGSKVSGPE